MKCPHAPQPFRCGCTRRHCRCGRAIVQPLAKNGLMTGRVTSCRSRQSCQSCCPITQWFDVNAPKLIAVHRPRSRRKTPRPECCVRATVSEACPVCWRILHEDTPACAALVANPAPKLWPAESFGRDRFDVEFSLCLPDQVSGRLTTERLLY